MPREVLIDGVSHSVNAATSYAVHDRTRALALLHRLELERRDGIDDQRRKIGPLLAGAWTDGTPSTKNWIRIDGRLRKISKHLDWRYDTVDWLAPWTLAGPSVHVTFQPTWYVRHVFNRWIVFSRGDTCFVHYSGEIRLAGGVVQLADVFGHLEQVQQRW